MQHDPEASEEEVQLALPQVPLGLVVGRILVVSGLGFAAAFAIFFLVGGIWLLAGISATVALVFILLMFAIERFAAHGLG